MTSTDTTGNTRRQWHQTHIWDIDGTPIQVPFEEQEEARALGARWNAANRTWYVPPMWNMLRFAKWARGSTGSRLPKSEEVFTVVSEVLSLVGGYPTFDDQTYAYFGSLVGAQREAHRLIMVQHRNGADAIIKIARGRLPGNGQVVFAVTTYPEYMLWSAIRVSAAAS